MGRGQSLVPGREKVELVQVIIAFIAISCEILSVFKIGNSFFIIFYIEIGLFEIFFHHFIIKCKYKFIKRLFLDPYILFISFFYYLLIIIVFLRAIKKVYD